MLQRTQLTEITTLPSSNGTLYTNPASTKTFVRGAIFHNTNTTSEIVTINVVPDSAGSVGTAAAANRIVKSTLLPDETQFFEFPYGIVLLDVNDTIQGFTTTAGKVTYLFVCDQDA
jgi:hypothetical protein